jgi:hypothetical protein
LKIAILILNQLKVTNILFLGVWSENPPIIAPGDCPFVIGLGSKNTQKTAV